MNPESSSDSAACIEKITAEHALLVKEVPGLPLFEYVKAVASVVGAKEIYGICKENNNVKIYLKKKKLLYVVQNVGLNLCVYTDVHCEENGIAKLIFPSISPVITDEDLTGLLRSYGSVLSDIHHVKVPDEKFSHVISWKRFVYMKLSDPLFVPPFLQWLYKDNWYKIPILVEHMFRNVDHNADEPMTIDVKEEPTTPPPEEEVQPSTSCVTDKAESRSGTVASAGFEDSVQSLVAQESLNCSSPNTSPCITASGMLKPAKLSVLKSSSRKRKKRKRKSSKSSSSLQHGTMDSSFTPVSDYVAPFTVQNSFGNSIETNVTSRQHTVTPFKKLGSRSSKARTIGNQKFANYIKKFKRAEPHESCLKKRCDAEVESLKYNTVDLSMPVSAYVVPSTVQKSHSHNLKSVTSKQHRMTLVAKLRKRTVSSQNSAKMSKAPKHGIVDSTFMPVSDYIVPSTLQKSCNHNLESVISRKQTVIPDAKWSRRPPKAMAVGSQKSEKVSKTVKCHNSYLEKSCKSLNSKKPLQHNLRDSTDVSHSHNSVPGENIAEIKVLNSFSEKGLDELMETSRSNETLQSCNNTQVNFSSEKKIEINQCHFPQELFNAKTADVFLSMSPSLLTPAMSPVHTVEVQTPPEAAETISLGSLFGKDSAIEVESSECGKILQSEPVRSSFLLNSSSAPSDVQAPSDVSDNAEMNFAAENNAVNLLVSENVSMLPSSSCEMVSEVQMISSTWSKETVTDLTLQNSVYGLSSGMQPFSISANVEMSFSAEDEPDVLTLQDI